MWIVELPEGAPDSDASKGVPVGPPSLKPLGLPLDIEVRLHNELFHRGLLTKNDAVRHKQDIGSALQSTLKLSIHDILNTYE